MLRHRKPRTFAKVRGKLVFFLTALFLLVSLAGAFLHHHEDGQAYEDCFVCKFVRQIVSVFILLAAVLFALNRQAFSLPDFFQHPSLLLPSRLHIRAPPLLS